MKIFRDIKRAYTLAEIIIVLVVISVVVACTMRVAKTRLDNITAYTYYSAYGVLNDVTAQMLADFNSNSTDYTDIAQNKIGNEKIASIVNALRSNVATSYTNLFLFAQNFDRVFRVAHNYDFAKYMPTQQASAAVNPWAVKTEDVAMTMPVWLCNSEKLEQLKKDVNMGNTELSQLQLATLNSLNYSYRYLYSECTMFCALQSRTLSACGRLPNLTYNYNDIYCNPNSPSSIQFPDHIRDEYSEGDTNKQYANSDNTKGWVYDAGKVVRIFSNGLKVEFSKKSKTVSGISNYNFDCQYTCTPTMAMYTAKKNSCAADQTVEWDSKSCTFNCSGGSSGTEPESCTQISAEQQRRDYCLYGKTEYSTESCTYGKTDTSCERGKHWSSTEPNCGCVADDATIPRKGANFCKLFVSLVNTKAGTTCTGSAISSDTTDFSVAGITEDFTLRNGMKVYNASQNPIKISDLDGNTDVGTVTKSDGTQIKTNEWGYVLYIDIDGTSGDSKLWEDVYPFYVTLSGRVIPAYKTDNASDYDLYGGGSRYYLQTSIQVDTSDSSGSRQYWLPNSKSISFRESACKSGYVGANTNYCKRGTSIGQNGTCASESSSCTIKKVSPIRVF